MMLVTSHNMDILALGTGLQHYKTSRKCTGHTYIIDALVTAPGDAKTERVSIYCSQGTHDGSERGHT